MAKFQLNQRVNTPYGAATIDVMPYNETSDVYIVWLDHPVGDAQLHSLAIPESSMTAIRENIEILSQSVPNV